MPYFCLTTIYSRHVAYIFQHCMPIIASARLSNNVTVGAKHLWVGWFSSQKVNSMKNRQVKGCGQRSLRYTNVNGGLLLVYHRQQQSSFFPLTFKQLISTLAVENVMVYNNLYNVHNRQSTQEKTAVLVIWRNKTTQRALCPLIYRANQVSMGCHTRR